MKQQIIYVTGAVPLSNIVHLAHADETGATRECVCGWTAPVDGEPMVVWCALRGSEQEGDIVLFTQADARQAIGLQDDCTANGGDDSNYANIGKLRPNSDVPALILRLRTGTIKLPEEIEFTEQPTTKVVGEEEEPTA